MSTVEIQATAERIQVTTGEGFVSYVIGPAGTRRVALRIALDSVCFVGLGVLCYALYFVGLYDVNLPNAGLLFFLIAGMLYCAIGQYRIQADLYQANNAHASFTISGSDLIVRFSGWFGEGSIHWLREEIRDVSYRLERNYRRRSYLVNFSLRFGMWRRVVYITTTSGSQIAVLEDLFLTKNEGEWLATAVRQSLELP